MSCFTNPFDVTIQDLQVILGPKVQFIPKEIYADNENESDEEYDQNNGFNIFTHQIRFTCKGIFHIK